MFTSPIEAIITPDIAPPMKLVTYTGIGFADIKSAWVNGSIATAMLSFLEPNFILLKNTKFMNEEPNTDKAPIAIGAPVSPIIAVKAIELSGAVATTVIKPPRIIPINTGEEFEASVKTDPTVFNTPFTTGLVTSPMK